MTEKLGDTSEFVQVGDTNVELRHKEDGAFVYVGDKLAGEVIFEGFSGCAVKLDDDCDGMSWWANGSGWDVEVERGECVAVEEYDEDWDDTECETSDDVTQHLDKLLAAWDGEDHSE